MTTTSAISVTAIMNRVAAEVGLETNPDPLSSNDQHFKQMQFLLQTCGEELCLAYPWEFLNGSHQIITAAIDTGEYDLPSDFHYMIPQTGWERASNLPISGPLSPQDWAYMLGRELTNQVVYVSFRLRDGSFNILPQPVPAGLDIHFEYQRKTWVEDMDTGIAVPSDQVLSGSDVVMFDRTLITRMLKLKWLESKGFDTSKSQDDFNQVFGFLTGKDKSAEVLSAGGKWGSSYLNDSNIPVTGFGQ